MFFLNNTKVHKIRFCLYNYKIYWITFSTCIFGHVALSNNMALSLIWRMSLSIFSFCWWYGLSVTGHFSPSAFKASLSSRFASILWRLPCSETERLTLNDKIFSTVVLWKKCLRLCTQIWQNKHKNKTNTKQTQNKNTEVSEDGNDATEIALVISVRHSRRLIWGLKTSGLRPRWHIV